MAHTHTELIVTKPPPPSSIFSSFSGDLTKFAGTQKSTFKLLCDHVNTVVRAHFDSLNSHYTKKIKVLQRQEALAAERLQRLEEAEQDMQSKLQNLAHNVQGFAEPASTWVSSGGNNAATAVTKTPATSRRRQPAKSEPAKVEEAAPAKLVVPSAPNEEKEEPPQQQPTTAVTSLADLPRAPVPATAASEHGEHVDEDDDDARLEVSEAKNETPEQQLQQDDKGDGDSAAAEGPESAAQRPPASPAPAPAPAPAAPETLAATAEAPAADATTTTSAASRRARWRWKSAFLRIKIANRMRGGQLSMLRVRGASGLSVAQRLERLEERVAENAAAAAANRAQIIALAARVQALPTKEAVVAEAVAEAGRAAAVVHYTKGEVDAARAASTERHLALKAEVDRLFNDSEDVEGRVSALEEEADNINRRHDRHARDAAGYFAEGLSDALSDLSRATKAALKAAKTEPSGGDNEDSSKGETAQEGKAAADGSSSAAEGAATADTILSTLLRDAETTASELQKITSGATSSSSSSSSSSAAAGSSGQEDKGGAWVPIMDRSDEKRLTRLLEGLATKAAGVLTVAAACDTKSTDDDSDVSGPPAGEASGLSRVLDVKFAAAAATTGGTDDDDDTTTTITTTTARHAATLRVALKVSIHRINATLRHLMDMAALTGSLEKAAQVEGRLFKFPDE